MPPPTSPVLDRRCGGGQLANSHVPFGGVGNSGMGSYHGKHGFDLLSHKKGIVKNKTIFDLPFRYAPFDLKKLNIFKHIM